VYHKKVEKVEMTNDEAARIHLTTEQYLQSEVDWLILNRKSKPGLYRYRADGHIEKGQRMV
jgi:hypothetical protein